MIPDRPTKHGLQPNVDARAAVAAVLGQPQAKVPPKPPESESSPKPDDRKERTDRALAGVVMLVLEGQALPLEVAPHSEDQDTQREVLLRANAGFSKVDEETRVKAAELFGNLSQIVWEVVRES